jgi:N-acetylglutamate synthase-like GNAT family acetyltransferase
MGDRLRIFALLNLISISFCFVNNPCAPCSRNLLSALNPFIPKRMISVGCNALHPTRDIPAGISNLFRPMCGAHAGNDSLDPFMFGKKKTEHERYTRSSQFTGSQSSSGPFSLKGLKFALSTVEDSMTLADLKMRAFRRDGSSANDELNARFSLFRAINERRNKGAICLMACLYGPFDVEILPFLCASSELSTSRDSELMRSILTSSLDSFTIQSVIKEWQASSTNRRIIVGCVECSTHEFQLSPLWAAADRQVYISDMAIHPAFQGLGIGRALLRALFRHTMSEGVQDLYLHVEEHNARAVGLYTAEGFTLAPDTPATSSLYDAMCFDQDRKNILLQRRPDTAPPGLGRPPFAAE